MGRQFDTRKWLSAAPQNCPAGQRLEYATGLCAALDRRAPEARLHQRASSSSEGFSGSSASVTMARWSTEPLRCSASPSTLAWPASHCTSTSAPLRSMWPTGRAQAGAIGHAVGCGLGHRAEQKAASGQRSAVGERHLHAIDEAKVMRLNGRRLEPRRAAVDEGVQQAQGVGHAGAGLAADAAVQQHPLRAADKRAFNVDGAQALAQHGVQRRQVERGHAAFGFAARPQWNQHAAVAQALGAGAQGQQRARLAAPRGKEQQRFEVWLHALALRGIRRQMASANAVQLAR